MVDFTQRDQTAKLINSFVDNSTNGQIKEIVSPSALEDVRLMLVNAIYFFGKWKTLFEDTGIYMEFQVGYGGPRVTGSFGMDIDYGHFYQYKDEKFGILELPYIDENFAMHLILPPHDMDIRDFEFDFEYLNSNYMKEYDTRLRLPKFKFEYEEDLNELFIELGAKDAFSPSGKFCFVLKMTAWS